MVVSAAVEAKAERRSRRTMPWHEGREPLRREFGSFGEWAAAKAEFWEGRSAMWVSVRDEQERRRLDRAERRAKKRAGALKQRLQKIKEQQGALLAEIERLEGLRKSNGE